MTLPEFLSPLTSPTAAVVGCLFLSLCSCHWELFSPYRGSSFQILFARGTSSVWILEFDGATRLRNRRRSRMTPGTGHDPPIIICVTASLLRQMQNQNQFIPVSPWRCKHVWGHGINKKLVSPFHSPLKNDFPPLNFIFLGLSLNFESLNFCKKGHFEKVDQEVWPSRSGQQGSWTGNWPIINLQD